MGGCDYEVFLSFRGPDTRTTFTDHLYIRLIDAGVRAFRDDEDLRVGEEIGPDLLGAIEQSKISIPILSKSYASSRWCLKELVKMVECRKRKGQIIMPIFYHVEPSKVRGGYGEALLAHVNEKRVDDETICKWRAALNEVGGLKGWNIENVANRHEGELVKQVVTSVLNELKKAYLVVSDFLVGVEDHVQAVLGMIGTSTDESKTVGIYGMGGIGKTTIAKVLYNKLCSDFSNCCFLADVRETSRLKGIECLQTRLILDLSKKPLQSTINYRDEGIEIIERRLSSEKVLIILDDIDKQSQLIALLGRRGCFGPKSRILITTRDRRVLDGVKLTYSVVGLDPQKSLKLFSKYVFRRDQPPIEKMEKSREIVKIADGLPLLLEIMGSALSRYGQKEEMWDDYLVKWKKYPIQEIRSKLMISYEALDDSQREIFFDIACLFHGYDKNTVIYMWKSCDLCPTEGLENLQLMSLIKIGEDNKLWMHDQLRDLSRDIVSQKSEQSRLWRYKDALELLLRKKRNGKLEALCLKFEDWSKAHFIFEGLAVLPNLRFFRVAGTSRCNAVKIFRETIPSLIFCPLIILILIPLPAIYILLPMFYMLLLMGWVIDWWIQNLRDLKDKLLWLRTNILLSKNQILPNLRWLSWQNFPWQIHKLSNFSLSNLVILDFSSSNITHDWEGWRHIERAKQLKVLDLAKCDYLKRTPDLSGLLMLERLILEDCRRLTEVDSSIGQLKRLVFLNLNSCPNLHYLPKELGGLSSLTELLLDHSGIREIPDWCDVENLESPHVQISTLTKAGDSLNCLTSLLTLSLEGTRITHLPDSIGAVTNLKNLSLSKCSMLYKLPDSIGALTNLENLSLSKCSGLYKLPDSIGALTNLENLSLSECSRLCKLPDSIGALTNLKNFLLSECSRLHKLPDSIGALTNLEILLLSECFSMHKLPYSIKELRSLTKLDLFYAKSTKLPYSMESLENLKALNLWLSKRSATSALPKLPESLTSLVIVAVRPIIDPDLSNLINLKLLLFVTKMPMISGPSELVHIPLLWWIERLSKLEVLTLGHPSITGLYFELGVLPYLKTLQLFDCPALECILQIPLSVTELHIGSCLSLGTLDISYLKNLSELSLIESSFGYLSRRPDDVLKWDISPHYDWDFLNKLKKQLGLEKLRFHQSGGQGLFNSDPSSPQHYIPLLLPNSQQA